MTKSKASDLLVAALESERVERIFGVPGEENLDVLESLRNSKIKFVVTRHEQSAAFMAATYGRLTGKPGVCLSTLGPGALNFSTGAAYALLGAMPMILITGQKGILSSKQARFQIVDVVSSMTPLTKMARQLSAQRRSRRLYAKPSGLPSKSGRDPYTLSYQRTSLERKRRTCCPCRRIRSKFRLQTRLR